jgi:hypothetical protein
MVIVMVTGAAMKSGADTMPTAMTTATGMDITMGIEAGVNPGLTQRIKGVAEMLRPFRLIDGC